MTFTKEQLREKLEHRITVAAKYPDVEEAQLDADIFKLALSALAGMETEPVAYMWDSDRKDVDAAGFYRPEHKIFAESSVKQYGGKVLALYAAPQPLTTSERAELQKFRRESQAQQDVVAERQRQIKSEGCTPEQDDHYTDGELAAAACCYAYHGFSRQWLFNQDAENYRAFAHNSYWPWKESWWKPKSPRQDLVRATALLLAEIERLDRQTAHREATK